MSAVILAIIIFSVGGGQLILFTAIRVPPVWTYLTLSPRISAPCDPSYRRPPRPGLINLRRLAQGYRGPPPRAVQILNRAGPDKTWRIFIFGTILNLPEPGPIISPVLHPIATWPRISFQLVLPPPPLRKSGPGKVRRPLLLLRLNLSAEGGPAIFFS